MADHSSAGRSDTGVYHASLESFGAETSGGRGTSDARSALRGRILVTDSGDTRPLNRYEFLEGLETRLHKSNVTDQTDKANTYGFPALQYRVQHAKTEITLVVAAEAKLHASALLSRVVLLQRRLLDAGGTQSAMLMVTPHAEGATASPVQRHNKVIMTDSLALDERVRKTPLEHAAFKAFNDAITEMTGVEPMPRGQAIAESQRREGSNRGHRRSHNDPRRFENIGHDAVPNPTDLTEQLTACFERTIDRKLPVDGTRKDLDLLGLPHFQFRIKDGPLNVNIYVDAEAELNVQRLVHRADQFHKRLASGHLEGEYNVVVPEDETRELPLLDCVENTITIDTFGLRVANRGHETEEELYLDFQRALEDMLTGEFVDDEAE